MFLFFIIIKDYKLKVEAEVLSVVKLSYTSRIFRIVRQFANEKKIHLRYDISKLTNFALRPADRCVEMCFSETVSTFD